MAQQVTPSGNVKAPMGAKPIAKPVQKAQPVAQPQQVAQQPQLSQPQPNPVSQPVVGQAKKKKKWWFWALIVLGIVIVGILIGAIL